MKSCHADIFRAHLTPTDLIQPTFQPQLLTGILLKWNLSYQSKDSSLATEIFNLKTFQKIADLIPQGGSRIFFILKA